MSNEIETWVHGWRGFLVGGRRGWHGHQRARLDGFRGNTLLPRWGNVLRGAISLGLDTLARGGLTWGFGAVPKVKLAGIAWRASWSPGVISNFFGFRMWYVRQRDQVKTFVFRKNPPRHQRCQRVYLGWNRLRRQGALPLEVYRTSYRRIRLGYALLTRAVRTHHRGVTWAELSGLADTPVLGTRLGWVNPASSTSRGVPLAHAVGLAGMNVPGLLTRWGQTLRVRRDQRRQRPGRIPPGGWISGVDRARRARSTRRGDYPGYTSFRRRTGWVRREVSQWLTTGFPTLVVVIGQGGPGGHLLGETKSSGVPIIHFGGPSGKPNLAGWEVLWNPTAAEAIPTLWAQLVRIAYRTGILRVLWGRIRLAER